MRQAHSGQEAERLHLRPDVVNLEKYAACDFGVRTKLPDRLRRSISPALASCDSALFTVVREHSYCSVSSYS